MLTPNPVLRGGTRNLTDATDGSINHVSVSSDCHEPFGNKIRFRIPHRLSCARFIPHLLNNLAFRGVSDSTNCRDEVEPDIINTLGGKIEEATDTSEICLGVLVQWLVEIDFPCIMGDCCEFACQGYVFRRSKPKVRLTNAADEEVHIREVCADAFFSEGVGMTLLWIWYSIQTLDFCASVLLYELAQHVRSWWAWGACQENHMTGPRCNPCLWYRQQAPIVDGLHLLTATTSIG